MRLVSRLSLAGLLSGLAACGGEPQAPSGQCAEENLITVYADADKDGFGAADTPKEVCPPTGEDGQPTGQIPRGFSANDDDCDDFRSDVNPASLESCDGLDNDCDEDADEGLRQILFFLDGDGDGFGNPDPTLGTTSCAAPAGYVDNNFDCRDGDFTINPDATEVCDGGADNDCDDRDDDLDPTLDLSTAPTWYFDADGDSFGDRDEFVVQCLAPGPDWVANERDCDDAEVLVNPSAEEICNRIDDDCDQRIDDSDADIDPATQSEWNADADGDGFGDPDVTALACWQPWFYVDNTEDCDDENPILGPPAPWVRDEDGDGFGAGSASAPDCEPPSRDHVLLALGRDCDDTEIFVNPLGNEVCDGVDNDCDDLVDDEDDTLDATTTTPWYADLDSDGFGDLDVMEPLCVAPPGYVGTSGDCDDRAQTDVGLPTHDFGGFFVNPDAVEVCDGRDNDCDEDIDDQDDDVDPASASTWYADFDDDGFGLDTLSIVSCDEPLLYSAADGDCDDTTAAVNPGATEVCGNLVDEDCDLVVCP